MRTINDLRGKKFGRLTCIEISGRDKKNRCVLWICQCECSNQIIVRSSSLLNGNTKSCGCLQIEVAKREGRKRTKHGLTSGGKIASSIYKSWASMKERCFNKNSKDYPNYGGRQITVCQDWLDFSKFNEWAMSNGFKEGLTIERIDVNGNYEPANCRWIPRSEQSANRRGNHNISLNGETKTLSEWARIYGINPKTVFSRLKSGWPVERLFVPAKKISLCRMVTNESHSANVQR